MALCISYVPLKVPCVPFLWLSPYGLKILFCLMHNTQMLFDLHSGIGIGMGIIKPHYCYGLMSFPSMCLVWNWNGFHYIKELINLKPKSKVGNEREQILFFFFWKLERTNSNTSIHIEYFPKWLTKQIGMVPLTLMPIPPLIPNAQHPLSLKV